MKTSTLVVLGVVAIGIWYVYANRPLVVGQAGVNATPANPGVTSPGAISDPANPSQTGYTQGVKNPLMADSSPVFSARRSRRNSIVAY